MAYVANKTLKFDDFTVKAGEIIPASVKWKGSSLKAAINVGVVSLVETNEIDSGKIEGAVEQVSSLNPESVFLANQVQEPEIILNCDEPDCGRTFNSKRGLSIHKKAHARE